MPVRFSRMYCRAIESWQSISTGYCYSVIKNEPGRSLVENIGWVPSYCFFESIFSFCIKHSLKNTCKDYLFNLTDYKLHRYNFCTDKLRFLIREFVRFNKLDKNVRKKLYALTASIVCKIMDYGFFINGTCNSAVVTARIKKFSTT